MAIFFKPVVPDTKVVFASFAFGKILVTCYIPKLEKSKQISDDWFYKYDPNMQDFPKVGAKFTFTWQPAKNQPWEKSLQIQAKSSDFILNPGHPSTLIRSVEWRIREKNEGRGMFENNYSGLLKRPLQLHWNMNVKLQHSMWVCTCEINHWPDKH